jgi:gliding motility-associated-like protein
MLRIFSFEKYSRVCIGIYASLFFLFSLNTLAQKDLPNPPSNFQTIPAGSFVVPMDTIYQSIVPAGQAPFNLKAYGLVNKFLQNGIPVKWAIHSGKQRDDIDFSAFAERYAPGFIAASDINFRAGPFIVPDTVLPCGLSTRQIISSYGNNVSVYILINTTMVDIRYTLIHRPKIAVFNNGGNQLIHTKILDAAGIPNYDVMDAANIGDLVNCYTFVSEPHADTNQITIPVVNAVKNFVMNGGNFLAQCHAVNSYENKAFFHTTSGISIVNSVISHLYPNADLAFSQMHGPLKQNEGGSIHNWTLKSGSSWLSVAYKSVSHTGVDTVVAMGAHLIAPSGKGGNVFYLGGHDYSQGGKVKNAPDLSNLERVNGLRLYLNGVFVPSRITNGAWANAGPAKTIGCSESTTLGCNLTGPPGSTFLWTPSAGLSCTDCPNPVARPTVTTLYQVQVTNGCIAIDTVRVVVAPIPLAQYTNTTVCQGASTSFTDQSTGATFRLWDFGDPASGINNSSSLQNPSHSFTTAGSFMVRLISGISPACSDTIIRTVIVNPNPIVTVNSPTICTGYSAMLTASGASGYLWSTGAADNTITVTPSATTVYTVTGTNTLGCTSIMNATVTLIPLMVPVTANTNVSCFGGSDGTAGVTVSGGKPGYSFSWNTNPIQTSALATSLKAGAYTVTITDAGGCIITAPVNIIEPTLLNATTVPSNVKCHGGNDGTVMATASGGTPGYSYSWNTSTTQTTALATGLPIGNYTVTVKDANGCTITSSANIIEPSLVTLSISSTNVKCNGGNDGSEVVTAIGGTPGYTYSWNTTPLQVTAEVTGLRAGNYLVTVKDANNCIYTAGATITEPPVLTLITTTSNVKCNGGNDGSAQVVASGGTSGYTYNWNTYPVQNTALATSLSIGTYTVTVMDANACIMSVPATITEPTALTVTAIAGNVKCHGGMDGTVKAIASGGTSGYAYTWNTNPVQTSDLVSGLSIGTYTVIVKDANGCTISTSAIITEPPVLSSSAIATPARCNGASDGTVTAIATGGTTSYTFSWNTIPVQTTALAGGLGKGNYVATITDANGCTTIATTAVTEPPPVTLTTIPTPVRCYGGNDGSAMVTVNGNTWPYTYQWNTNPVQTTSQAVALKKGSYTVIVTDSSACQVTAGVVITEPLPMIVDLGADQKLCSETDPPAYFNAGSGFSKYLWKPTGDTTQHISVHEPGTYSVTVFNQLGCTTTSSANVIEVCPPRLFISNSFTPNSDHTNDNYNVYGEHFTNFHMFIFNRWGEIIFESKDRNIVWDGIYRGVPMPIGVYPWLITYTGDSEEFYGPFRMEGSVTVVR